MNLAEVLGTKDKKEQVERVQQMIRALSMPVIDVVLRYDPIADKVQVSILGGQLAFPVAHHILDLARKDLQTAEVKANIEQAKQNGGPPEQEEQPEPEVKNA